jgi:hypothetical protein
MDERGVRVAQSDATLENAANGTGWEDARTLLFPPDAKLGVYTVRVGVYEAEHVRNLPYYRGNSPALGRGLMSLWQIRVSEE